MKIWICQNDDYATVSNKDYSLYFGYEYARDGEGNAVYGFEAMKDGKSIFRISQEDMECSDNEIKIRDMVDGLLAGIMFWLGEKV